MPNKNAIDYLKEKSIDLDNMKFTKGEFDWHHKYDDIINSLIEIFGDNDAIIDVIIEKIKDAIIFNEEGRHIFNVIVRDGKAVDSYYGIYDEEKERLIC